MFIDCCSDPCLPLKSKTLASQNFIQYFMCQILPGVRVRRWYYLQNNTIPFQKVNSPQMSRGWNNDFKLKFRIDKWRFLLMESHHWKLTMMVIVFKELEYLKLSILWSEAFSSTHTRFWHLKCVLCILYTGSPGSSFWKEFGEYDRPTAKSNHDSRTKGTFRNCHWGLKWDSTLCRISKHSLRCSSLKIVL